MKIFNNVHKYLLLVLIFLIPSGFYNLEGIIIALLFINWLFFQKKGLDKLPLGNILLIAFFFFITFNYLIIFSNSSYSGILKHISFLLIPLTLSGFKIKKEELKIAQIVFVSSSLLFILIADIYCIVDIIITHKTTIYIPPNIFNKYSYYGLTRVFDDWHPTYVSFFLNISLILLLKLYTNKKYDIKFYFVILILIVNIFLLNSIAGILTLFIFPFLFVTELKPSKKQIMISTTVLILFTALIVTNPFKIYKITRIANTGFKLTDVEEETNNITIRLVKWKTALEVFSENKFFGVGMVNVKDKMVDKYKENNYLNCARYRYSPHNQYLFFAVALGTIGVISFLILLAIGFYNTTTNLERLILIMFIFFCITEEMISRQQGLVFFALFFSFINHNHHNKPEIN